MTSFPGPPREARGTLPGLPREVRGRPREQFPSSPGFPGRPGEASPGLPGKPGEGPGSNSRPPRASPGGPGKDVKFHRGPWRNLAGSYKFPACLKCFFMKRFIRQAAVRQMRPGAIPVLPGPPREGTWNVVPKWNGAPKRNGVPKWSGVPKRNGEGKWNGVPKWKGECEKSDALPDQCCKFPSLLEWLFRKMKRFITQAAVRQMNPGNNPNHFTSPVPRPKSKASLLF